MKRGLMFIGLIVSLLIINFVNAQEDIYCTDSDAGRVTDEKTYTIDTRPFEGETYTDIHTGEEFLFDSRVERGWNSQVEEQKDGTFTITYTKSEGTVGIYNFFEKGEVYGKENILSEEFVTKEDFCVLIERVSISELKMEDEYNREKESREFGEGAFWFTDMRDLKDDATYLVRCLNNDCNSAKVNECEGDNCAVMEYGCHPSRLGGLSEATAFKYYLFHPIQFFKDYNTLFKKVWDENQGFVLGSILTGYLDVVPHCVDGRFVGPEIDKLIEEG